MLIFERHLYRELELWKRSNRRKPLILRGARQVGKTTLVKAFAEGYRYKVFLNLERPADKAFFEQFDDVHTLLEAVFLKHGISKEQMGETLLFIDEIQESPAAIQMLRFFYEELPALHLIAAGSLLEFAVRHIKSFPVGRVSYLYLHPLNFQEYLKSLGRKDVLEQLLQVPVKPFAHAVLMELFHRYAIIGGMPEIIAQYIEDGQNLSHLPPLYESLWSTYQRDVEKYAGNELDRRVIRHIMATAHLYLDKRIKFQHFGHSNYRSREVKEAFLQLDEAKVIRLIYPTTDTEPPARPDLRKQPRLQFLDTGIVNHLAHIQADLLGLKDLSQAYKGSMLPHLIYQEVLSLNVHHDKAPLFWVREKSQSSAEVDMVYTHGTHLIPIEIKSGKTGRLRSLHQFINQSACPYAIRIYGGPLLVQKLRTPQGTPYTLLNLPYYLGTMLPAYISSLQNGLAVE